MLDNSKIRTGSFKILRETLLIEPPSNLFLLNNATLAIVKYSNDVTHIIYKSKCFPGLEDCN